MAPGMNLNPDHDSDHDQARAETELPLPPAELATFLTDSERLFRLNPHLEIERWEARPDGFRLVMINELNGRRLETGVRVAEAPDHWEFRYQAGLKQATILAVKPTPLGSRLILTDLYPRILDPADPRVAEVDRSLVPWVAALRRHLLSRQRWGWAPGWRWWHERLLPGLPPRQRRIVRLIVWVSLIEFLVFLGLVLVLG